LAGDRTRNLPIASRER